MRETARNRRERREARRGGRRGTALFVTTIILVVVAVGTAGAAFVVRQDTDDVAARAEPVHAEVRALAAAEDDAARRLRILRTKTRAATQALSELLAASLAQVDASNHAVDVANQAVDRYNSAQAGDVATAFQGAGDAALGDLEARTAAVRDAVEAAQRAIAGLQGTIDG